jgi:hypothetical protein
VFPELSLTGYSVGTIEADLMMRHDDPRLLGLAKHAGDAAVLLGFSEQTTSRVHTFDSARPEGCLLADRRRGEPRPYAPPQLAAKLAANGTETSGSWQTPPEPIMPLNCRYVRLWMSADPP